MRKKSKRMEFRPVWDSETTGKETEKDFEKLEVNSRRLLSKLKMRFYVFSERTK